MPPLELKGVIVLMRYSMRGGHQARRESVAFWLDEQESERGLDYHLT